MLTYGTFKSKNNKMTDQDNNHKEECTNEHCHHHHDHRNTTPIRNDKIGVNEKCPCGSDKKYKKCCMNLKS